MLHSRHKAQGRSMQGMWNYTCQLKMLHWPLSPLYTLIRRIHNEVLFWLLRHRESSTFVKPFLQEYTLIWAKPLISTWNPRQWDSVLKLICPIMKQQQQYILYSFSTDANDRMFLWTQCRLQFHPTHPFLTKQYKPYTRFHTLPKRKEWPHSKESNSKWITNLKTCGL